LSQAGEKEPQVHKFDYLSAHNDAVGDVTVARWEQYSEASEFPFRAMWYCIPPGSNSPLDQHPEIELSLVLRGTALVDASSTQTVIEQGSSFLLNSNEAHTVYNKSDEPLLIFSAYWMPGETSHD
jgi:quercetin dioxygenase-like cupin family protein